MCCEHRPKIFLAAEDLEDALGEDLGADLSHLERSVGAEGRGLPDEGISDQERSHELDDTKQHREVPWHDANPDAEGNVPYHNAQLQISTH